MVFEMKLVIDCCETRVMGLLKDQHVQFESRQLASGDMLIVNDNSEVVVVFERKTISDLVSSIQDGRFRQQRERLLEFRKQSPNTKIVYLVEGRYPHPIASGALENLILNHSIFVLPTFSVDQTCKSLVSILKKCQSESKEENMLHISHVKSKKCVSNPFAGVISAVPGIGPKTALDIVSKCPTMASVLSEIENPNGLLKPRTIVLLRKAFGTKCNESA